MATKEPRIWCQLSNHIVSLPGVTRYIFLLGTESLLHWRSFKYLNTWLCSGTWRIQTDLGNLYLCICIGKTENKTNPPDSSVKARQKNHSCIRHSVCCCYILVDTNVMLSVIQWLELKYCKCKSPLETAQVIFCTVSWTKDASKARSLLWKVIFEWHICLIVDTYTCSCLHYRLGWGSCERL